MIVLGKFFLVQLVFVIKGLLGTTRNISYKIVGNAFWAKQCVGSSLSQANRFGTLKKKIPMEV